MVDYRKLKNELENLQTLEDKSNFVEKFPHAELPLNLSFYRVRYDDGFDKNDKTQFGYIQDASKVKIGRYNIDQEQVLYTSTNPKTAFMEIESHNNTSDSYYISVWRKMDEDKIMTALSYNPDDCKYKSNADMYNKDIKRLLEEGKKKYGMGYKEFIKNIGERMESDSTYEFSSLLASSLLKKYEALITMSAQSDGQELNVTFNKETVDKRLKLSLVLHGDGAEVKKLLMNVDEVGIVENEKIIWKKIVNAKVKRCNDPRLMTILGNTKKIPLVGLKVSSDKNRIICESEVYKCEYKLEDENYI